MKSIEIVATGKYLPKFKASNEKLARILNVSEDFILSRTGIKSRYYIDDESIEFMATMAANDLFDSSSTNKENYDSLATIKDDIDLIVVATTSTTSLMPGISFKVQKTLGIKNCMCMDILAGCAGFVNAFDIARLYIVSGKCKCALVIGVEQLSKFIDKSDISTAVVLSDGAGAVLLRACDEEKFYFSNITSDGEHGNILTCNSDEFLFMNGKEIYKYAVTETVNCMKNIFELSGVTIDDVSFIVPHQANLRIIDSFTSKLGIDNSKVFKNIESCGNTFCASIPIALDDLFKKNLIKHSDKIVLLGYGGGLNTGAILLEV